MPKNHPSLRRDFSNAPPRSALASPQRSKNATRSSSDPNGGPRTKENLGANEHDEIAAEPTHRPKVLLPAVLSSTILHLLLLLLLSLVVYGGGGPKRIELTMHELQPTAVDDLAEFDLQIDAMPELDQSLEVNPELSIPVEISVPILPDVQEPEPQPEAGETRAESPQSATPVSTTLAQPLAKAAMSIQKRVSEAGGKQGEVQFALAWKNINDVDLHVITPGGERISHLYKSSRDGGLLDVDMNVRGESKQPVENVRWLTNAPSGRYTVLINLFRVHRPRSGESVERGSPFQLLAQLGKESELKSDVVNSRNQVAIFRFKYVPESMGKAKREAALKQLDELQETEENAAARLLVKAKEVRKTQLRERLLNNLINLYPHTDAAVDAMRMLGGSITKGGF